MGIIAERWRSIPGYQGYQASNLGRIRCVDRTIIRRCPSGVLCSVQRKGQIMKPERTRRGYLRVSLSSSRRKNVHTLVLLAWRGEAPPKHQTNHKNGNKADNRLRNLEQVTASKNVLHAYKTGLMQSKGEQHHAAKLTEILVKKIRKASLTISSYQLAKQYGVSDVALRNARTGRTWKHLRC